MNGRVLVFCEKGGRDEDGRRFDRPPAGQGNKLRRTRGFRECSAGFECLEEMGANFIEPGLLSKGHEKDRWMAWVAEWDGRSAVELADALVRRPPLAEVSGENVGRHLLLAVLGAEVLRVAASAAFAGVLIADSAGLSVHDGE